MIRYQIADSSKTLVAEAKLWKNFALSLEQEKNRTLSKYFEDRDTRLKEKYNAKFITDYSQIFLEFDSEEDLTLFILENS